MPLCAGGDGKPDMAKDWGPFARQRDPFFEAFGLRMRFSCRNAFATFL